MREFRPASRLEIVVLANRHRVCNRLASGLERGAYLVEGFARAGSWPKADIALPAIKRPSAMVKTVAINSVALAPVAIRRNTRGLNDIDLSERSSASDRITAIVVGDLPGISHAIPTVPREAERARGAYGIRTP